MKEKDNLKEKAKRPIYEPPRARDLTAFPVYVIGSCPTGSGPNPPACPNGSNPQEDICGTGIGA